MVEYTAKDILKELHKARFTEIRIRGDHHIFKNEINGKKIAVPYSRMKDVIKIGTAKSILRRIKRDGEL